MNVLRVKKYRLIKERVRDSGSRSGGMSRDFDYCVRSRY